MLGGDDNEKGQKKSVSVISKKTTLNVQQFFFCIFLSRCFARLERETSRNRIVTRFIEEILYAFLFTFFHCRSFAPWWPLAFRIFSPPL